MTLTSAAVLGLSGPVGAFAGDADFRPVSTERPDVAKHTLCKDKKRAHRVATLRASSETRLAEKMAVARAAEGKARMDAMMGVLEELLAARTISRWSMEQRQRGLEELSDLLGVAGREGSCGHADSEPPGSSSFSEKTEPHH